VSFQSNRVRKGTVSHVPPLAQQTAKAWIA
jgi:hypothetical protein